MTETQKYGKTLWLIIHWDTFYFVLEGFYSQNPVGLCHSAIKANPYHLRLGALFDWRGAIFQTLSSRPSYSRSQWPDCKLQHQHTHLPEDQYLHWEQDLNWRDHAWPDCFPSQLLGCKPQHQCTHSSEDQYRSLEQDAMWEDHVLMTEI